MKTLRNTVATATATAARAYDEMARMFQVGEDLVAAEAVHALARAMEGVAVALSEDETILPLVRVNVMKTLSTAEKGGDLAFLVPPGALERDGGLGAAVGVGIAPTPWLPKLLESLLGLVERVLLQPTEIVKHGLNQHASFIVMTTDKPSLFGVVKLQVQPVTRPAEGINELLFPIVRRGVRVGVPVDFEKPLVPDVDPWISIQRSDGTIVGFVKEFNKVLAQVWVTMSPKKPTREDNSNATLSADLEFMPP